MKTVIEVVFAVLVIIILIKFCVRYEAAHPLSDEEETENQTFQP